MFHIITLRALMDTIRIQMTTIEHYMTPIMPFTTSTKVPMKIEVYSIIKMIKENLMAIDASKTTTRQRRHRLPVDQD
jgi:hypothetical protein